MDRRKKEKKLLQEETKLKMFVRTNWRHPGKIRDVAVRVNRRRE